METKPKSGFRGKPNVEGRPKGSQNKFTRSVREAFQLAFEELGGVPALVQWGRENPTDFYKLLARLIPVEVTGPNGKELSITVKHYDFPTNGNPPQLGPATIPGSAVVVSTSGG